MNPLKAIFNKVFDQTPPKGASDPSKDDAAFEWNPEEESVAPTSARTTSWKRRDTPDEGPSRVAGDAADADVAASGHNLPAPTFEQNTPRSVEPPAVAARPHWNEPPAPKATVFEEVSFVPKAASAPESAMTSETRVRPYVPETATAAASLTPASSATVAQSAVPVSDFEDVYRKAGIKSPVHGYGVERVYRLLTSRRLVALDRTVKRSALLTALDAAGVPPSDVSQDAVLRRKALTAFEAEKALELQSLRSRNESRAEALQDTVETFTRQKQSQIERLAQGSTSAVRAQSDLEIRKRMEQDRLYRSLAYFVEPLPSPTSAPRPALPEKARVIERFDTVEMPPPARLEPPTPRVEPKVPVVEPREVKAPEPPAVKAQEPVVEAVIIVPPEPSDVDTDTKPISQSGLEMALKAAAEEARLAGWGQTAIVEDSGDDAVDALRKLREATKTEPES